MLGQSVARLVAAILRRAYQWTGWRPSDRDLCQLGRRFRSLQHLPIRMADGRTLYLDLRNPVSIPYLLEGEFPAEKIETLLMQEVIRPGDLAVDIGANVGWYASLLCRGVGETGAVYAFEPNPFLVRLLGSLSQDHPNLVVHPMALGDKDTETDFFIPENWISGSCMPRDKSSQCCRVRMARLDDALPGRPDFVKLDAEGAEMAVLVGAKAILDAPDAPLWMVELSTEEARPFGHDVSDVVGLFHRAARARYTAYRIDSDVPRLHPLELPLSGDFWINALFVPAERGDRIPEDWLCGSHQGD